MNSKKTALQLSSFYVTSTRYVYHFLSPFCQYTICVLAS